ncbi:BMP family lipoprotein [Planomonospora algeriensis]
MLRNQFGKMAMTTVAGAMLMAAAACGGNDTGSGGSTTASPGATSEAPKSSLKVGLAYDVGGRGDKSFNDSAYAGLERAGKELGAEIKDLSPAADGSNRGELLRQLADAGYNPIIGVGFAYGEDIKKAATEYPDIQFAVVDSASNAPNVTGLLFAEEQGSYLAGVAAAEKTKSNHLGFVGGVENDLIKKFQAGFEAGAKSVKSDIKIDVKYLTPDGDFSGFKAPDKGKITAEKMYQDGADIVYHASGDSGLGVFQARARRQAGHRRRLRPVRDGQGGRPQEGHHDLHDQACRQRCVRVHQGLPGRRQGRQQQRLRPEGRRRGAVHLRRLHRRRHAQGRRGQEEDHRRFGHRSDAAVRSLLRGPR